MNLVNKGLFGKHDNRAPERDQVFKTSRWSQYQWSRFLEASDEVDEVIKEGSKKIYSFPHFAHETFTRLYDHGVERLEKVRPEDAWAEKAHTEIEQMPDWTRLADRCRGDRLLAGEAAKTFVQKVMEGLPEPKKPLEDPEPLRSQVKGLQNFLKGLKEAGENTQKLEESIQRVTQQGKEAVQNALEYAASVEETQLRNAIREALVAAHEQVDEQVETIDAFCGWGSGAGTPEITNSELKAAVAEKVRHSEKLQLLAKEAGRLRRTAARKQRSKTNYARSEVSDIERGNDLERLLPSELVKLTDPSLELQFYQQFMERGLLQYKMSGKEKEGRGPIVICIDQSGSMQGSSEIWSKGIALALLQVAAMQRRDTRVIHFNSYVQQVDDWEAGKVDPVALLGSMVKFYGGGTDFQPPLEKSLEAITKDRRLKKADVIFITDGLCEISGEFIKTWRKEKKALGFTCYAVHIAGGGEGNELHEFADKVIEVGDVKDDSTATDVVFDL